MKKGLLIAVAMLLPMSLFGKTEMFGQNGELFIYTWGYGDTLAELLYAFKGFLDPKTGITNTMAKIALAFSIFFFTISKAVDSKVNPVLEFGRLLIIFAVINYMFLTASNKTYIVADQVNELHNKTVTGLPIGIGHTLSFMSVMEKILLEGFEQYYTTPQSSSYSKSGLGFTLSALVDVPTLRVGYFDTYLQKNMDKYVESCYSINATDIGNAARAVNLQDVAKSSNLVDVIFKTDDGKIVMQYKQGVDALGNPTADSVAELTTCGDAAQKIKTAFYDLAANKAEPYYYYKVLKQFSKDQQEATDKMEDTIKVFFPQAVSLRENLQQMMVMNALDDGIRNTAMALGLDGVTYTAATAVADQTITTAMQSQGRLAQTYLPLAKAYLTIIIVSIAWLMAILAILFNTFHHIKMFFTLCISMVLWTPILSIINFLNDLSLQKSFININANDAAFTYSNYASVIQAITANSNFLNYMVMLTPMLAFALAKGSEMGFVSIATSLSQQLAGASRAASSFATQQALSTSSSISSPDGSRVSTWGAGKREDVYAVERNGNVVTEKAASLGMDGVRTLNETSTTEGGSRGTQNESGFTTAASVAGMTASQLNAHTKKLAEAKSQAETNHLQTAEGRKFMADFFQSQGAGSGRTQSRGSGENDSVDIKSGKDKSQSTSETTRESIEAGATIQGSVGASAGGSAGPNASADAGVYAKISKNDSYEESKRTATSESGSGNKQISWSESDIASLMNNKEFRAAFNDHIETSKTESAAQVRQATRNFETAQNFTQSFGNDTTAAMVNNYKAMHGASQGEALVALEEMAAKGDLNGLAKYAGLQNNANINGDSIANTESVNYLDKDKIGDQYKQAAAIVENSTKERKVETKNGDGSTSYYYQPGTIFADHTQKASQSAKTMHESIADLPQKLNKGQEDILNNVIKPKVDSVAKNWKMSQVGIEQREGLIIDAVINQGGVLGSQGKVSRKY